MATHSSILAWRIPWTEEPGRLQSTGLQRVGHDGATSLTHLYLYNLQDIIHYLAFFVNRTVHVTDHALITWQLLGVLSTFIRNMCS